MAVRVLFFGVLKDLVGTAETTVELPEPNATVGSIFALYSSRFATSQGRRPSILFAKNREFASADTPVSDHDEIAFLPPVSGGSGSSDPLFLITRDPIDKVALVHQVQRPEDGAVVTFDGVVRNNTKGRETLYLEYECYEDLALRQMRDIGEQIARQFAIGRVGIVHRLGRLEVGEASVVVAASAPHRKPAFEAALEAINRLKREVPIWKKEYFADGAVWVEGEWDESLLAVAGRSPLP